MVISGVVGTSWFIMANNWLNLRLLILKDNNKIPGVHIIPFSIPFGIDKFESNGGKFFTLRANVFVEFEKCFLIVGIFCNWGHFYNWVQMGANLLVIFEIFFLTGGIFSQLGANVLVEFKNVF